MHLGTKYYVPPLSHIKDEDYVLRLYQLKLLARYKLLR